VTEKAGVGHDGYGMGAATGDYDNDGFLDLYLTNFGDNVLYHNNGDGTFTDVTRAAGVAVGRWSTSAAFVDYDNDGLLDLFVGNYVDFTVQGNKRCYAPTGEPDYCTPMAYKAVPSRLFHNLGNGMFADVTEASGISTSYGPIREPDSSRGGGSRNPSAASSASSSDSTSRRSAGSLHVSSTTMRSSRPRPTARSNSRAISRHGASAVMARRP